MIEEYEKQCNRCFEIKPPSAFYRRSGRAARYGDGLMGHCKKCQDALSNAWRKAHRNQSREISRAANKRYAASGKSSTFSFRVTQFERDCAEDIATAWGCTISDVVRRIVRARAIELNIIADTQDGSIVFLDDYQQSQ